MKEAEIMSHYTEAQTRSVNLVGYGETISYNGCILLIIAIDTEVGGIKKGELRSMHIKVVPLESSKSGKSALMQSQKEFQLRLLAIERFYLL
jgi:hypothetical protein